MIGLFYEMGPLRINNELKLSRNPTTWNKHFGMLFIDNPVGTGYSLVGLKSNSTKPEYILPAPEPIDAVIDDECIRNVRRNSMNSQPLYENGYVTNQAAVAQDYK